MSNLPTTTEILEQIRLKRQEQDRLFRELWMWEQVKAQGIDPEQVKSFTFDLSLWPQTKQVEYRQLIRNLPGPLPCPVYNVVNMKDGSRRILNPEVQVP